MWRWSITPLPEFMKEATDHPDWTTRRVPRADKYCRTRATRKLRRAAPDEVRELR
jgi:hypothetical protein